MAKNNEFDLPQWLDVPRAENASAVMVRGLTGPTSSWGELIASAQTVLGVYQDFPTSVVQSEYNESDILPLIAAARILDAASKREDETSAAERTNLALSAGIAFATYGNFPSASACLRGFVSAPMQGSIAAVIGTAAPSLVPEILAYCSEQPYRKYLEALNFFLSSGKPDSETAVRSEFVACVIAASNSSSFEGSLLRSARLCLENVFLLCIAKVCRDHCPELPRTYRSKLIDNRVFTFLPPQRAAVVRQKLLSHDGNFLVSLPTSTGKTFLGELCLVSALTQQNGIACFVVPYIALGNQVTEALQKHLPREFRIHKLVGGYREVEPLDPDNRKEIVVATPERLDAMLRFHPEWTASIRIVVCDEAHMVENGARGIRLEGMITRFRLLQASGAQLRLILLSAVLSNDAELRSWVDIADDSVVRGNWRPTARRLAIWRYDKLTWYQSGDPFRRKGAGDSGILGEMTLPWPNRRIYPTANFAATTAMTPLAHENVAYLTDWLWRRYELPILCVSSTKDKTRGLAAKVAERFEEIEPLPDTIAETVAAIEANHPIFRPLVSLLKKGVAYHNSTVPQRIRELIELAVRNRELRAVCSTTTLAEGVDLPFRFTVISDWMTWDETGERPMSGLLFRNVAGRCGRAGVYTEGDTIIFDNPLGNQEYTDQLHREEIQRSTFLSPVAEQLQSVSEVLLDPDSKADKGALTAILGGQFLASVPENPNDENLLENFIKFSFAGVRADKQGQHHHLERIFQNIEDSLLDESGLGAFAVANSPLKLTPLGEAVNQSGFSPESCRQIAGFLSSWVDRHEPPDFIPFVTECLQSLCGLPEQSNRDLRDALTKKGKRHPVKPNELSTILSKWTNGEFVEDIFATLPSVQKSQSKTKLSDWLLGGASGSTWDSKYDKFIEFVSGTLEAFLPWLLRACETLSHFVPHWNYQIDWKLWALNVERGVNSRWAGLVLQAGAPVPRKTAVLAAAEWPQEWVTEADPLGLEAFADEQKREIASSFFEQLQSLRHEHAASLADLQDWLRTRSRDHTH